ncbi:hypothetical protein [Streptomyces sp. NPDC017230]|uniref:hypothetical protein n=1 Tax=unclassified Streptomyces TaxID=2593676 RepID=UPI003795E465
MSESVKTGPKSRTGDKVRTEASATAGQAGQAAGQVAGTAAEQARHVADEARQQAGTAIQDLRGRAMDEANGQTRRAAGTLRQWADDLSDLAEHARNDSAARSLAQHAADRGHRAAGYLETEGAEGLVTDLQGFARRRPGAFLGGALLAGLAVGRLAKAGSAARSDGSGQGPATGAADRDGLAAAPDTAPLPPGPAPGAPPRVAPTGAPVSPATGMPPGGAPGRAHPEV